MNPATLTQDILQYGALGLVFVMLIGIGWGAKFLLERLVQSIDRQTTALEGMGASMGAQQVSQAEIKSAVASVADDVADAQKAILDELRRKAA